MAIYICSSYHDTYTALKLDNGGIHYLDCLDGYILTVFCNELLGISLDCSVKSRVIEKLDYIMQRDYNGLFYIQ
jgi:hypothetical protein